MVRPMPARPARSRRPTARALQAAISSRRDMPGAGLPGSRMPRDAPWAGASASRQDKRGPLGYVRFRARFEEEPCPFGR